MQLFDSKQDTLRPKYDLAVDFKYKHNIFIAEHGSWNRSKPIGYRIPG
jgi:hypothetical protein